MKGKFKFFSFAAALLMLPSILGGCTGGTSSSNSKQARENKAQETFVTNQSSDNDFNNFLDDYLHRHLRYDDNRIGPLSLGTSVMFNKEWESMALAWFDSTGTNVPDDRHEMMEFWNSNVGVDKFGYVWSTAYAEGVYGQSTPTGFVQGWPFPHYQDSRGSAAGYEFNVNGNKNDWTTAGDVTGESVTDGFYTFDYEGTGEVTYLSPTLNINTFHAPFVEMSMAVSNSNVLESNVEDIYLYWRTAEEDYGEDKVVQQSKFATIPFKVFPSNYKDTMYFPMYQHPKWGQGETVTGVRIVIRPKAGKTMKIKSMLNFIRFNYDARQSNNATLMLTAARNYQEFTQDFDSLERNIGRYRAATQFMLTHLKGDTTTGATAGLIDLGYFVGHDGVILDASNIRLHGHGIGNGYWDLLASPQIDLYSNIYYYKALEAMRDLELAVRNKGLETGKTTVQGDTYNVATASYDEIEYEETVESLTEKMEITKASIQSYFWNEETKRFHLGYNWEDATKTAYSTEKIDYGFVVFNLEAIVAGIATDAQAKDIMDWVTGVRTVAGDDSTGADIYKYEFAPRTSTKENDIQYMWNWNPGDFSDQVQDGGATLWTSYYDLMARIKVYGVDNAWARFKQIQAWYDKVKAYADANESAPFDFYGDYYANVRDELDDPFDITWNLQGVNGSGAIGLDSEFLENAILYAVIPHGILGLSGREDTNTLTIKPNLPSQLDYYEMENLMFSGVRYDLLITDNSILTYNIKGSTENKFLNIKIKAKSGQKLYVGGKEVASTYVDGRLCAKVPFGQRIIEIA